ncbi:MAG: ATPase domain-containing protein [Thermoproteota archaeon]|nr:AAA family ATPase [Candidatus Brockarchaeota archaeon]
MKDRVPFGIAELDNLIEGGLPKGGLIVIAGSPGAGKTILSAQFIYNGAMLYKEKGVYVCLSESKENFKSNMLGLGWDFNKLEDKGIVRVVELPAVAKIRVEDMTDLIVEEAKRFKAQRLVVDSLSALNLALGSRAEVRAVINLIARMLKNVGCTTLMITESPWGTTGIGMGIEEFLADGIILMESVVVGNRLERRLMILKMRTTSHDTRYYRLNIAKGTGIMLSLYPEM